MDVYKQIEAIVSGSLLPQDGLYNNESVLHNDKCIAVVIYRVTVNSNHAL